VIANATAWIEPILVGGAVLAAVMWSIARVRRFIRSKGCGCDARPSECPACRVTVALDDAFKRHTPPEPEEPHDPHPAETAHSS
jgi:hypothetical protein